MTGANSVVGCHHWHQPGTSTVSSGQGRHSLYICHSMPLLTQSLHFASGVAKAKCIIVYWSNVSVCVCLSLAAFSHYCTDLDVTWGNGRGNPLVVHYWSDLQSVHWFHCYDNRAPNTKCKRVLVLALCLVIKSPGEYFNNHTACAMLLTNWKKQLTDMLINRQ